MDRIRVGLIPTRIQIHIYQIGSWLIHILSGRKSSRFGTRVFGFNLFTIKVVIFKYFL
ncbi:hypothetical protein AXF42_Ash021524 [Apostasia shenzhenica]|uniref:Uncharacterized protein n=1 Tax=Apostasia shenzhenica TaxID=1088818 RepID=A0A2H9ZUG5_9ASPA|nr:hypothetical protein AXF42_Ash021524 [Apostasia shenzhenica]